MSKASLSGSAYSVAGALGAARPLVAAFETATAAGLVQKDDAKLILQWHQGDHILVPSQRCAQMAREVLEKVGFEAKVEIRAAELHRECADQARIPERPHTPKQGKQESLPDDQREPTSAAARSRIAAGWANRNPEQAVRLLCEYSFVVQDLVALDGEAVYGTEIADLLADLERLAVVLPRTALNAPVGQANFPLEPSGGLVEQVLQEAWLNERGQLLKLLARVPSKVEVTGKPVSVLAAAREALSADVRSNGMLPPVPKIRVVEPPQDSGRLPDLSRPTAEERQLILPALQPQDRNNAIGPAPWLQVYDRLGGHSMAAGRGAPLALRLWVEALAWAPPAARWGMLVDIELEVRDLVEALWPDGWNRGRQLPRLRTACATINGLGWLADPQGRTEWAPVLFRRRPGVAAALNDPVLLQVQLPSVAGAGAGARFSRKELRKLGLHSAPTYRAYLGLIHEWDRKLSGGTRPYSPPRRGTPLPWPGFSPVERRRLVFGPDETATASNTLRKRQYDADAAFEALSAHGVIDLKRDQADPRIYRPVRRDLRRP